MGARYLEMPAVMLDRVVRPDLLQDIQDFLKAAAAVLPGHAGGGVFITQPADTKANVQPAPAEPIKRSQ
jgi:hypothetical protein